MPSAEPYGQVKLKGILFGDDNWGTVLDEEPPHKNQKGIQMKRFLVNPGDHLMKQYPQLQKPGALTYKDTAVWVEYPMYYVDDNNPSRTNAIVRIDCGFDGRETTQTKKFHNLKQEIKTLQEENENIELSNMHLTEVNKQLRGDITSLIKDMMEINNMVKGERHGADEGDKYSE